VKHKVGDVVNGRYMITRAVSSGGMGSVYKATDLEADRVVALKVMLTTVPSGQGGDVLQKFQDETRILQKLTHAGIPRVWDASLADGIYSIAMDFIEGKTLDAVLAECKQSTGRPLPPKRVVEFARQVCDILEYLHEQPNGPILHRDIKPSNIVLREGLNQVVLVDFGLARTINPQSFGTKTQAGTFGFSALEQIRGRPDTRSDIYALGVTMHYLVSGVEPVPFEIQPLAEALPSATPALAKVIDKAAAERPADRFLSARDMNQALKKLSLALENPYLEKSLFHDFVAVGGSGAGATVPLESPAKTALVTAEIDPRATARDIPRPRWEFQLPRIAWRPSPRLLFGLLAMALLMVSLTAFRSFMDMRAFTPFHDSRLAQQHWKLLDSKGFVRGTFTATSRAGLLYQEMPAAKHVPTGISFRLQQFGSGQAVVAYTGPYDAGGTAYGLKVEDKMGEDGLRLHLVSVPAAHGSDWPQTFSWVELDAKSDQPGGDTESRDTNAGLRLTDLKARPIMHFTFTPHGSDRLDLVGRVDGVAGQLTVTVPAEPSSPRQLGVVVVSTTRGSASAQVEDLEVR